MMSKIKDKKGQAVMQLFSLIVVALVLVIIVGTYLFFFDIVDTAFQGDIMAGSVNVTNSSDITFGQVHDAFFTGADLLVILFLFAQVIAIVIAGFITRDQTPKVFFMVDFLLILMAYILAVYISNAYESILGSLVFANLIGSNLGISSTILLFLPTITVVTGFLTMIVTYSGIPRRRDESEVGGF